MSEALNGSWHGSEMVPVNDATSSIGGQLHALERELRALAEDMDHEAGAVRAEMAAEAERVEAERTKAEAQKTAEQQAKRGAR
ncbi:MAG: hypothetical protein U1E26_12650 [Coriobacteriia bacterium]|nr:hypothetical protein [Coriobacteriia bacterium]